MLFKNLRLVKLSLPLILFILLFSCTDNKDKFHDLAVNYAEYMIEKGTDHYGNTHTPVFLSMLNRRNDSIFKNPKTELYFERSEKGIRDLDRSWNATNPFNDEGLYKLLYLLSEDTGNDKYKHAADSSLKWIIENTQHPDTKLIAWGEHLGFRVDKEKVVRHENSEWGDLKHEIHGYWSLWERVFELAPDKAIDYAYAYWNYHVYDKENMLHAHQTRYDTFLPDSGFIFPRMVGHMSYLWALAYQSTNDEKVKSDMCTYINNIITNSNNKRCTDEMVLFFYHPKEGVVYKPFGNMEAAFEIHRAMQIKLHDSIINKLETFNNYTDQSFTHIQEKIDAGVVTLTDSLLNIKSVANNNLWCNSYGKASSLSLRGLNMLQRYSQNKNEILKEKALSIADQYIGEIPVCDNYSLWPESLSAAIDLQIQAYRLTSDKKYLEQAKIFGENAIDLFMDNTSPLPRIFPDEFDHYEAITGGADLMMSFYTLSKVLNNNN